MSSGGQADVGHSSIDDDVPMAETVCKDEELAEDDDCGGDRGSHDRSRDAAITMSDEEEEYEMGEDCPCGGDGSCVKDILNNMNVWQADNSVRTATVNKTAIEMIQKTTTVAGKTTYMYSPKDLFTLINKNISNLSVSWMRTLAEKTLLNAAVINGRYYMVPILVDCGLMEPLWDTKVRDESSCYYNKMAMEIAETMRDEKMISVLRHQKAIDESLGWMHRCARDGNITAVSQLMEMHPQLLHSVADIDDKPEYALASSVPSHAGTQPIFWAVTSGNCELVETMLAHGADINSSSSKGETLLTRAVACGHCHLVKILIKKYRMQPDEPGYNQKTPLQCAVNNKDIVMLKQLIELETQVPDSIMNDVAKAGHMQLYKILHEHVGSLDQQDDSGKFPLYHAVENDALKLAEKLIKAKAKLTPKDGQNRNLLHLLATKSNLDQFHLVFPLIQKNEKEFRQLLNDRDRHVGGECCFLVRGRDQGEPAYHYVTVQRFLLQSFRQKTREGGAIDVANYGTVIRSGWGSTVPPDVVKAIERRHDISKVTTRNELDLTPLNLAILKENTEVALALIDAGADVNIADCFGMTPLHMACMRGNLDLVKRLEEAGASVTAVDHEGRSPKHAAELNHNKAVLNFLKGRHVMERTELETFRHNMQDFLVQVTREQLHVVRSQGKDLREHLLHYLRQMSGEINTLCYKLVDSGPIMAETSYPAPENVHRTATV